MKTSPAALVAVVLARSDKIFASALSSVAAGRRTFRFVPYGSNAPSGVCTIACDGRVPGATLELTHWNGNETPDAVYADTSTGMAIKWGATVNDLDYEDALICNNHFDSDGVLSVWACLNPKEAQKHATLLVNGAEAGDFGEWSSDLGVKLNVLLESYASDKSDEEAFDFVLEKMPGILDDFEATGGSAYEHLWGDEFDQVQSDWKDIEEGSVSVEKGPGNIAIVYEKENGSYLSSYALHRKLCELDIWKDTTRVLRVSPSSDGQSFGYCYEKIGHGWVGKLVERHMVPSADKDFIVTSLNEDSDQGSWKSSADGLTSICATEQPIPANADQVARILSKFDEALPVTEV